MKKPANAGAHGLSGNVSLAADISAYSPTPSALQARTLSHRYGLSAAAAATIAGLAFGGTVENWRGRQ